LNEENELVAKIVEKNKEGKTSKVKITGLYLPPINNKNLLKMSVEDKNYAINNNINNIKRNILKSNPKNLSKGQINLQNSIRKMNEEYSKNHRYRPAASQNKKPTSSQMEKIAASSPMEKIAYERSNLLPRIQSKYLEEIRKSRDKDNKTNNNKVDDTPDAKDDIGLESDCNNNQATSKKPPSPYKYDDQKVSKIMEIKKRYNISPKKLMDIKLYEEKHQEKIASGNNDNNDYSYNDIDVDLQ